MVDASKKAEGEGKMRFRSLSLVMFMGMVIFCGCAPKVWQYPGRSQNCGVELGYLHDYIDPAIYFKKYAEAADKKQCRDEIINAHIFAIDCYFYEMTKIISRGRVGVNLASDLAVLGLNLAGTVSPANTAKNILSPIAAGITGAKTPIDKDLFYEQTMPALISKNEALRLKIKANILKKMDLTIDKYPLSAALADLQRYHEAGMVHYALVDINIETGKAAKEAQAEIEGIEREWLGHGKSKVRVPEVIGRTQEQAKQCLNSVGLTSMVEEQRSCQPKGTVIDQDPKPGTPVDLNSQVRLKVAAP